MYEVLSPQSYSHLKDPPEKVLQSLSQHSSSLEHFAPTGLQRSSDLVAFDMLSPDCGRLFLQAHPTKERPITSAHKTYLIICTFIPSSIIIPLKMAVRRL